MKSRLLISGKSSATAIVIGLGCLLLLTASCTKHTAQRSAEGAATGALISGVGGLVTGLVFGGDALDSAARGAVYGAATGATAGAIVGSKEQKAVQQQQTKEMETFRKKIGDDAYNGMVALAQCKHAVALANAREAAKDPDGNKALAGLWLELLTYADSRQESKARELFPAVIEQDARISSNDQAEEKMRLTLQKLMTIREQQGLPKICE